MACGDYEKTRLKCTPQHPSILIRKLVELMDHPMSEYATERHIDLLKEFLNALHCAFWLQDIPYIIRLYDSIVKELYTTSEFRRPFECLLHFTAYLPMRTKASDQLTYERDFQEYFSTLGYLILHISDTDLKKLTIHAIKNLLFSKSRPGICCVSSEYCQEMAEKSLLPAILAQALQKVNDDLYPLLLDLLFLVCQMSTVACQKVLQENGIEYLLQRLESHWKARYPDEKPKNPSSSDTIPVLEDTCCVLWKLLNAIDSEKVNVKAPSQFALWSLQYAFRWCTVCPGQRINRNNLTAIILKIFVAFQDMDFFVSEVFQDIIVISSATGGCHCLSALEFTEDELDFQFKKIIWSTFHFVRVNFKDGSTGTKMLKVFTMVLCAESSPNKNHIEQYSELAVMILKIIPKLLHNTLDYESVCHPLKKIHSMVEGYLQKDYDVELLAASVYCYKHMLSLKCVLNNITEYETVNVIIGVCNKIMKVKTLTSIHQRTLAHGFCILQILCGTKYVTNKQVVNPCIDFLQRVIDPKENDPLIDVRVTICAIYLLWECIMSRKPFYRQFLKRGGIYTTLDVTEVSTFSVKSVSLGILADIAQKSSCVPYLITWRKRGKRLVPLLLEIFRDETEKECDSLRNTEILEKKPENVWFGLCQQQKNYFQNDCILKAELLKICRSRVHGILYALKVKFKERVEIANEHYKLFNEKLNAKDQMTLLFAQHFLSLLLCQSWLAVSKQFETDKITPVDSDNEQLKKKIHGIRQWRSYLRSTIERIIREEKLHEQSAELKTYITLKEARLSDALDALLELRYISNCTERMFQMRQKFILQKEVEMSRAAAYNNFHRTICDLPFTDIYHQKISIQSNIIYEKKEEQCPIAPISVADDEPPESLRSDHALSEPGLEC